MHGLAALGFSTATDSRALRFQGLLPSCNAPRRQRAPRARRRAFARPLRITATGQRPK